MVQRVLRLFHQEFGGLHKAAVLLALSAGGSSLLAILRDRLLAGTFGAGRSLDIYYAAFRIPDFLYVFSLSLVSVTVLIPFFLDRVEKDKKDAHRFINNVFTLFLVVMVIAVVVIMLIVPYLIDILTPGFHDADKTELIILTRILLFSPLLLGLSNLFSSVIQSFRRFFVYALSPILYNIGIILGIILFYPTLGLNGIVLGVILGAFMHLAIQFPGISKLGFIPSFSRLKKINFSEIKKVVALSFPRTLGLSLNQIVLIFITAFASTLGVGSIAVFNLSFNLQSVPLAVVGVSYSVAAFPTLSKFFVGGKKKEFVEHVILAGRQIVFWSIPIIVLLVVLRAQIVRVIFGYGKFDWADTRLTAAALAIFSVSITAQAMIILLVRSFYAAGRTVKPVVINLLSSVFIIVSMFLLVEMFENIHVFNNFFEKILRVENVDNTVMLMPPLAFSLGMILNAVLLTIFFQKEFNQLWRFIRKSFYQISIASISMGVVSYYVLKIADGIFDIQTFVGIFFQGLLSAVTGGLVWFVLLFIMKNREMKEMINSLKEKFWKTPVVAPGPKEL